VPSFWDILPANYWRATQETLLPAFAPTAREAAAQLSAQRHNKPDAMSMAFELAGGPMLAPALKAPLAPVKQGIRAYHGSPHDFDKFDLSKIGTGEGAQAYGHGLYFAEKEGVARQYRDQLAGAQRVTFDGKPIWEQGQTTLGMVHLPKEQQLAIDAITRVPDKEWAVNFLKTRSPAHEPQGYNEARLKAIDLLESGRVKPDTAGRMYEVNINAHPDQFLDWDKPLSGQAEAVKQALGRVPSLAPEYLVSERLTGGQLAPQTMQGVQQMKDAGIPGLKYLDQGSRQVSGGELIDVFKGQGGWQSKIRMNRPNGEQYFTTSAPHQTEDAAKQWAMGKIQTPGTRNYVVFDDKLIDILKKYGIAGMGVIGMGAGQQSPVLGWE
jgi:hypothetical protein